MDHSVSAPVVMFESQMQVVLDDDSRVPVHVELAFDARDPYAVSTTFRTADGNVSWVFARDLMRDGLKKPVGEGDIMIRPAHPSRGPVTVFSLSSPSGDARLEGNRHELYRFVQKTYEVVPEGHESQYLQVDRAIGELLAEK